MIPIRHIEIVRFFELVRRCGGFNMALYAAENFVDLLMDCMIEIVRYAYMYNLFDGEQPTSVAWTTFARDVVRSCQHRRRVHLIDATELHQLFIDAEINVVGRPAFSLFAQPLRRFERQIVEQYVQHTGRNIWKVRLRRALHRDIPNDASSFFMWIFQLAVENRLFSYRDVHERMTRIIEEYFPRAENVREMVIAHLDRFVEIYREVFMAPPPAAGDGLWAFQQFRRTIVQVDMQRRNMAVDDVINVAKRQRMG